MITREFFKNKIERQIIGILCLSFGFSFLANAQLDKPREWGEVKGIDAYTKKVSYDTSASAVVLFDKVRYYADIREGLTIVRHKRVKILKESGKEWGDYRFKYYSGNDFCRVSNLRAQTMNVGDGGKIEIMEVKPSEIYRKEIDKDHSSISFAFPAVKVGSILEYEITTNSKGLYCPETWYFQSFIPTLYSEIRFEQSPDLQYNYLQYGDNLCKKYTKADDLKWALQNLPALVEDEFVPNPMDYSERITFQLLACAYPISEIGTWNKATYELLNSYKDYIKSNNDIKAYAAKLVGLSGDTLDVIKKIYYGVAQKYRWNKEYRLFTDQTPKEFMSKMSGNSAEKNLFMIGLLRSVGIDADPVILSTRDNGVVYKDIPLLEQYNHVVAVINFRGKPLILDAASPNRPYSLVDQNTLECSGYRLSKKKAEWITILPQTQTSINVNNQLKLNDTRCEGIIRISYKGYKAREERERINTLSKAEYEAKIASGMNVTIDSISFANTDNVDEDLIVRIYYSQPSLSLTEKLISFPSLMVTPYAKNPFLTQDRTMPVVLPYTYEFSYSSMVQLPAGYKIDAGLQDSRHGISPTDTFTLLSSHNTAQNFIQVVCKLRLGTSTYMSDRYPVLQNFFENIVDKSARVITLSKI